MHRCAEEPEFHYDVEGAGHYGIFSGRRWRELAYPVVRDFIAGHQGTTAKRAASNAAAAKPAVKRIAKPVAAKTKQVKQATKPAAKPVAARKKAG